MTHEQELLLRSCTDQHAEILRVADHAPMVMTLVVTVGLIVLGQMAWSWWQRRRRP
jgi:hypothetical protein